jgi:hypothetical protein
VKLRPGHLRSAVQPFGAQQQHDGLQLHADVGPLGPAHVAVDGAEQGGGRSDTVPVRRSGPLARRYVLARDTECAVALLTEGGPAPPLPCTRSDLADTAPGATPGPYQAKSPRGQVTRVDLAGQPSEGRGARRCARSFNSSSSTTVSIG